MTETQRTPQRDRVDTDHLRDYSQLRRSVADRKLAGVAGGLGRHLNIDPTIVRVAFVVLVFFGGAGFLLYAALWLFVPEDGKDEAVIATSPGTRTTLIVVAAVLAALLLVGDSWGDIGFPWPLVLLGLVVALLLMNRDKPMSTTHPPPPGAAGPTPHGGHAATGAEDTLALEGSQPSPYAGAPPPTAASFAVPQPPEGHPDRGPHLFWFTVALLAVALGALGMYDVAGGAVADGAYPALALAVIGAMLVVGAWFGRAGGLIALGIVAAIALFATSVTEPSFDGARTVEETPTTALQVEDRYFVPAGSVLLDMSNIRDVERLDGRTIEVEANAGELVVVLPDGVDATVDANVGMAGEVTLLGETRGGTGVAMERTVEGGVDAPEMDLNLDLVVGSIEVRQ